MSYKKEKTVNIIKIEGHLVVENNKQGREIALAELRESLKYGFGCDFEVLDMPQYEFDNLPDYS